MRFRECSSHMPRLFSSFLFFGSTSDGRTWFEDLTKPLEDPLSWQFAPLILNKCLESSLLNFAKETKYLKQQSSYKTPFRTEPNIQFLFSASTILLWIYCYIYGVWYMSRYNMYHIIIFCVSLYLIFYCIFQLFHCLWKSVYNTIKH